jgi:hypothetical protein
MGWDISVQPFEFTQMERQGAFIPEPWYDCLSQRCFGALVLTFELNSLPPTGVLGWQITPKSLVLMSRHYRPHKKIGKYYIYLPKAK